MKRIIILLVGNIVFNVGANILMKIGITRAEGINLMSFNGAVKGLFLNPVLVAGLLSYVSSLAFYIFVLEEMGMSIVYPIAVSSTIILITIASSFLLHESISCSQITGVAIIMIGIFVLTR